MSSTHFLTQVYTPEINRDVLVREDTEDRQVWADTFTGLYHVPPGNMPVPRTVLDVGANIGLTSAHYQWLWPDAEVVAVEMDAGNADLARRNAPSARVWKCAVAAAAGPAFYDATAGTDAFALGSGSQQVECVSLTTLIELSFNSLPLDFLKLDVEGMEWSLFEFPGWAPLVRHLLVELHGDPGADSDSLVRFGIARLRDAGFEARPHPPHPRSVFASR